MSNSIASSHKITFSTFSGVPNSARALIWQVFFATRQRGIDLSTHFPWINQTTGTYCLALSEANDGPVVATLVLRECNLPSGSRCAMIGMVCVDQSWRGRGLSKQLLDNLLIFAAEQKIASLLLWTGQPNIYVRHGFVPDTYDSFGRVTLNSLHPHVKIGFTQKRAETTRGLPPFAQQLICFESEAAQLIVIKTAMGMALAEWKGVQPAVLDLIETALPSTWHLNAFAGSSIFEDIRRRGHSYTPMPCAKRMVLHLNSPVHIPYISVLDRI